MPLLFLGMVMRIFYLGTVFYVLWHKDLVWAILVIASILLIGNIFFWSSHAIHMLKYSLISIAVDEYQEEDFKPVAKRTFRSSKI